MRHSPLLGERDELLRVNIALLSFYLLFSLKSNPGVNLNANLQNAEEYSGEVVVIAGVTIQLEYHGRVN
jgi:hypothetical protein